MISYRLHKVINLVQFITSCEISNTNVDRYSSPKVRERNSHFVKAEVLILPKLMIRVSDFIVNTSGIK